MCWGMFNILKAMGPHASRLYTAASLLLGCIVLLACRGLEAGDAIKAMDKEASLAALQPVSYTHLTLPTNREV